jgi:hypothetical protein
MELSELQRLKQVEDENGRLKHIVAEPDARHAGAQGGRRKKVVSPIARRELARSTGSVTPKCCETDVAGLSYSSRSKKSDNGQGAGCVVLLRGAPPRLR